jgi:lipid A 3-O-deacylase
MSRLLFLVPVFLLAVLSEAQAGTQTAYPVTAPSSSAAPAPVSASPVSAPADNTIQQPDLISFGLAYVDFDKQEPHRNSGDLRLEYRWGMSLLPLISSYFTKWDPYIQFHPFVGGELGTLGQLYGLGGFAMDVYVTRHWIFTWSEGAGLYYPGDAVRLGSFLEFRSQAEVGWRFDDNMRLTFEVSHISNAKITHFNPGSEMAGIYLHVPVGMLF